MKKVLSIVMMLTAAIAVSAQKKVISLNRDFNFSGRCLIYSMKEEPTKSDECNMFWEFENRIVGVKNSPKLYIKDQDGKTVDFQYWNGDVKILMTISDKGKKTFAIADDTFIHLRIIEFDGSQFGYNEPVYVILLCSVMMNK